MFASDIHVDNMLLAGMLLADMFVTICFVVGHFMAVNRGVEYS